jgi:hypothetical protein
MSPRRSVSPTHSKRIGKPISEINASECSPIVQPMSQPTTVQSLKLEDREIKAGDAAEGRKYKNRNIWTDARSPIVTSDHTKNFDASDCPTVVKTQTGKQWDASEDKHQDARKHSSVFEGSIAEGKERSTSKSLPSGTNTVVRTLSSIFGLSHQKLGAGPTLALSCEPVQVNVKAHDRELEVLLFPASIQAPDFFLFKTSDLFLTSYWLERSRLLRRHKNTARATSYRKCKLFGICCRSLKSQHAASNRKADMFRRFPWRVQVTDSEKHHGSII